MTRWANRLHKWLPVPVVVAGLAVASGAAAPTSGRLLDRVAARVNEDIITENELLVAMFGDARGAEALLPGTMSNVREILNNLIDDRLLAQAARGEVEEIPEERIANRVEAMVKDRRALFDSEAAFLAALGRRGWDLESYKKYLREEEERSFLINSALARRARLTEDEARAHEEELRRKGESLDQYWLRHLLVALPPKATAEEAKKAEKRVVAHLEQLRRGVPFDQLAREQSDDKSTRRAGGDLGWIAEKQMQRAIFEAVRGLKEGQFSQPVQADKGIHIFLLVRKRTARDQLFEKRMEQARKEWVEKLRRRAEIKILLPDLLK